MGLKEWLLKILGCNEQYYRDEFNKAADEIESLKTTINELNIKIKELENQIISEDDSVKPTWLNSSVSPYIPVVEVEGDDVALTPQDIYMECPTLRDVAIPWRSLSQDQKLNEIWKYVINAITYSYDADDNWQTPIVTVKRKKGDCEDGTILFITLCRLAHVRAESVFNACGLYDAKYGHSYPVARMSDGKWYVFETTLDYVPSSPQLFKGSKYTGEWGYANWKFAGQGPNQL